MNSKTNGSRIQWRNSWKISNENDESEINEKDESEINEKDESEINEKDEETATLGDPITNETKEVPVVTMD